MKKPIYSDENVRKSILAKKLCAICGGMFVRHRGDRCVCQPDCFCTGFMKLEGDKL